MQAHRHAGLVCEALGGQSDQRVPGSTSRSVEGRITLGTTGNAPALESNCLYFKLQLCHLPAGHFSRVFAHWRVGAVLVLSALIPLSPVPSTAVGNTSMTMMLKNIGQHLKSPLCIGPLPFATLH